MALASLLSGLALANAGLGIVHGFAAPVGGMFAAPHGAVCAALLPSAMETNLKALSQRNPSHPALARYDEIARWLTGRADATAADGSTRATELMEPRVATVRQPYLPRPAGPDRSRRRDAPLTEDA